MGSPFDVLGVGPDAGDAEVEEAYRRRVKETHPDHGGSAEAFQRVREAYAAIRSGEDTLDGDGPRDEQPRPSEAHVEYLNYEVLEDYGWALGDDDLFGKAAGADLGSRDHGEFVVEPGESLLEAAEGCGLAWPFACRGGACANCAVRVLRGELTQPVDHVLPSSLTDRGIRLSCNGLPTTDELTVVYNLKHRPDLDDLRLPPYPFERSSIRR